MSERIGGISISEREAKMMAAEMRKARRNTLRRAFGGTVELFGRCAYFAARSEGSNSRTMWLGLM